MLQASGKAGQNVAMHAIAHVTHETPESYQSMLAVVYIVHAALACCLVLGRVCAVARV